MKNEERKMRKGRQEEAERLCKKTLFCCFLLFYFFFFIFACASAPSAPDELDLRLREVSNYLNDNVPKGNKIAFVSVQSDSAALTEYVIDVLISNAVNDRIFSVVDRQQLDAARAELNFNMSGEVSDKSAQAVGQMLGAQTIITGKISKIGSSFRLNVRALETETVKLQGSNNWDIASGKRINDLLAMGGSGKSSGAASSGASSPGGKKTTPAKPSIPNGTYTFWPRPQAQDSGIPLKNVFLAQMVYTNDFTVIYFADKAQGSFQDGIHGTSTYCWQEWKTLQLQDLDNPSKFYTPVNGEQSSNGGGAIWSISFKRLPVKRFKLSADSWGDKQEFSEVIVPDQPDE